MNLEGVVLAERLNAVVRDHELILGGREDDAEIVWATEALIIINYLIII